MNTTVTFLAIQFLMLLTLKSCVLPFMLGHFEILRDFVAKKK